jgi:hypothetical protein
MFTTPAMRANECTIVVASTKFALPVYWCTHSRQSRGLSVAASASAGDAEFAVSAVQRVHAAKQASPRTARNHEGDPHVRQLRSPHGAASSELCA